MKIVPIRDLKDTVKIEKLCTEEGGPVFVTKNGYGKLVVMDIEYFEKITKELEEASIVNEGIKDYNNGNLKNGKDVFLHLKDKYGL